MIDRTAWNSTLRPGKPLKRGGRLKSRGKRWHRRKAEGLVYGPYHDWMAHFPCLINVGCYPQAVGHHVKTVGAGGQDFKNEVPLCVIHHGEVHRIGRKAFERKYGLDLAAIAEQISHQYPEEERNA